MKLIYILLFFLGGMMHIHAQEITGQWNGLLKVQGTQLRLVFHISKTGDGYTSTMDSPDQHANGIPVSSTTFRDSLLHLEVKMAQIVYDGKLSGTEIHGTFKQGGLEIPLNLSREVIAAAKINRPQEPKPPFPYKSEDVIFSNQKAGLSLAGTLTLPAGTGKFPAVILVTGSGPQNRDEEIMGHKPFLVLADYLTRQGIAVLRYDDRGVGKSTGNFSKGTTQDFAEDAKAALAFLKTRREINTNQIGIIGHSEGGLIAPMIAASSKDVAFIVLMAGPGLQGDKLMLLQQQLILQASGVSQQEIEKQGKTNSFLFEELKKDQPDSSRIAHLTTILSADMPDEIPGGMTRSQYISMALNQVNNPWMRYFIKYDPVPVLKKVKCPVLALNGENDLQVPAKENLAAIKTTLQSGGNKKVTTVAFPKLNHLFQESKTGLPAEYSEIEQTISPAVLEKIAAWIHEQTK